MKLQDLFTQEAWETINNEAIGQNRSVMGLVVETLHSRWASMTRAELQEAIGTQEPIETQETVPEESQFDQLFKENTRAYNVLTKNGINDIETLLTKTKEDLAELPRCGQGSIDFIESQLFEKLGLQLAILEEEPEEEEPEEEELEEEGEELEEEELEEEEDFFDEEPEELYHLQLMDIDEGMKVSPAYAKAKELYAKAWDISGDDAKEYIVKNILTKMKSQKDISEFKDLIYPHFPATPEQMAHLSSSYPDLEKLQGIVQEVVGVELYRLDIEQAAEVINHIDEDVVFEESDDFFSGDF